MANTLLLVLLLFREQERTPTCGHKNPTSRVGLLKVFAPKNSVFTTYLSVDRDPTFARGAVDRGRFLSSDLSISRL